MPTRFRPYHLDQGLLLPPDLRDWLPEGHLAHHVGDLVDGLDLTAFYTRYELTIPTVSGRLDALSRLHVYS